MASIDYCRSQLRKRLGAFKRNPHEHRDLPLVERVVPDASTTVQRTADDGVETKQPATSKSLRFFAIIVALSFTGLLTALEATITSTALPTIINDLGGTHLYIWVINVYFLTMFVFPFQNGHFSSVCPISAA